MKKVLSLLVFALLASSAAAQVVIPDIGVDVGGFVTSAITVIGGIIAIAIGGAFAFMIVRKGFSWASSLMSKS